jgi:hypothetical protein
VLHTRLAQLGCFWLCFQHLRKRNITDPEVPPPIVGFLQRFCQVVALLLLVLAGLAISVAARASVPASVWVIVAALSVMTVFCAVLTYMTRL